MAGRVVHGGVVLGAAVVPDGDAVGLPAPAHLVLGDKGLADQEAQQVVGAGVGVLTEAHAPRRVVVGEVGGEGVDVEDLLAGFRVGAHHRVFGVRVLGLQRQALVDRHGGGEGRLETVVGAQVFDLLLDRLRQALVGQGHVCPQGVATHRWAFHAAQHTAHGRGFAPAAIAVPGILVAVAWLVGALVNLHQAWRVGMARRHWVVFQLAELAGEGHMGRAGDVLIAQEQHFVLEQQPPDFSEQAVIVDRLGEVHAEQFGTDTAGEWFYAHLVIPLVRSLSCGRCARSRLTGRESEFRSVGRGQPFIRRQSLFIS